MLVAVGAMPPALGTFIQAKGPNDRDRHISCSLIGSERREVAWQYAIALSSPVFLTRVNAV